jgi:glycosyltransferase involved in cell wall biosynthesis
MTHDNQIDSQMKSPSIAIVIPCYNEAKGVVRSLDEIFETLNERNDFEIITINDGSTDKTLDLLEEYACQKPQLHVINNKTNLGYGASLKKGIRQAKGEIIVITDADCTYPANQIPVLLAELDYVDMAVGARTGNKVQIPFVRRPAKWALLKYARWMARADIKDLNSGLRAFRKKDAIRFFPLLPDGFSFTSTITLAMHVNGMQVCYHPIDYNKRIGKSSIRPISDTLAFFSLVLRTTMYFRPLQVFGTLSGILFVSALGVGVLGKLYLGEVPDVATMSLMSTSLIFLGLGLIGDLLNTKLADKENISQ